VLNPFITDIIAYSNRFTVTVRNNQANSKMLYILVV